MKYVIRKVPERDTTYLEKLIPGAEIYSDTEHVGPIKSFVAAMKFANDNAVYVQDDMILCKDFKRRCDEVIAKHEHEVVQLANFTFMNDETRVLVGGYHKPWETPWCLCVYVPKWIADVFVKMYETGQIVPNQKELDGQADDWLLAKVVDYIGDDEWLEVPNLAGHPLNKSTVLSERDSQIRMCMNFEYDKAEPRGDMTRELKYYKRDYEKYRILREQQR